MVRSGRGTSTVGLADAAFSPNGKSFYAKRSGIVIQGDTDGHEVASTDIGSGKLVGFAASPVGASLAATGVGQVLGFAKIPDDRMDERYQLLKGFYDRWKRLRSPRAAR
jgi:hypothetical protein